MARAVHDPALAEREKNLVALSSVGAAVLLTSMKVVVGLATGSIGILSEAAHSGIDLLAALMTFWAVRASSKPPDSDHLYGHGKIENFSALFETGLLLATCVWIAYEAVKRLVFGGGHVEATVWSFVVMGISIVVDLSRSRALASVARRHRSQALEADALHFSTDVWSSTVVILGLLGVVFSHRTGLAWLARADSVAALGVAGIAALVSIRLGRKAVDDQTSVEKWSASASRAWLRCLRATEARARDRERSTTMEMPITTKDQTVASTCPPPKISRLPAS